MDSLNLNSCLLCSSVAHLLRTRSRTSITNQKLAFDEKTRFYFKRETSISNQKLAFDEKTRFYFTRETSISNQKLAFDDKTRFYLTCEKSISNQKLAFDEKTRFYFTREIEIFDVLPGIISYVEIWQLLAVWHNIVFT